MNISERPELAGLTAWFRRRLDELEIDFESEPLNYEVTSDYDRVFYRLQDEARDVWRQRWGEAPTPGVLTQAFFNAEFERCRAVRVAALPLRKRLRERITRWWSKRHSTRTL